MFEEGFSVNNEPVKTDDCRWEAAKTVKVGKDSKSVDFGGVGCFISKNS